MKLTLTILGLWLFLPGFNAAASPKSPGPNEILNLTTKKTYKDLLQAVRELRNAQTLLLGKGVFKIPEAVYLENLSGVTLQGMGRQHTTIGVTSRTSGVITGYGLSGFTVKNLKATHILPPGEGCFYGVLNLQAADLTLTGNDLAGSGVVGLEAYDPSGNWHIENNIFRENQTDGVALYVSGEGKPLTSLVFKNNVLKDNARTGFFCEGCESLPAGVLKASGNTFTANAKGAAFGLPPAWARQLGVTQPAHLEINDLTFPEDPGPLSLAADGAVPSPPAAVETSCPLTPAQAGHGGKLFQRNLNTNYGPMRWCVNQGRLDGIYFYNGSEGRVKGVINEAGTAFSGSWSEAPTHEPPDHAGDLEFRWDPEKGVFTGRWRYGSGGEWVEDWIAHPVSDE